MICPRSPSRAPTAGLRLGEVADVVEDHQPLIGDAVGADGANLMLVIEKFPGTNTRQVTEDLEAAIAALAPAPGLHMDPTVYRPAGYLDDATANLGWALLIGLVLVFIALMLFLFDWRVAVISAVAIPLSLAAAGLVLYLLETTINTMVVAGLVIAIGALIADAVLDVENLRRRLRESRNQRRSAAAAVLDAAMEMRRLRYTRR